MTTVLVSGAGGPLGVNFCRSLLSSGENVRLIGTDANAYHLPLSLCDQTYLVPMANTGAPYQEALSVIANREGVEVIVPTHPAEVRTVARLRDQEALAGMQSALPRTEVIDVCDDKTRTQKILATAGIGVPRTRLLMNKDDVRQAFAEFQRDDGPVWIRGAGIPGHGIGGAALPCRTPEIGWAWVEHYRGWGKMAASEYLPGANLTWMALFSGGQLIASGARERLEYVLPHVSPSGITGAPAVSRTITNERLESIGECAIRAVDRHPHGAYFVDCKSDREGTPLVTEINGGRCGTTVHFYSEAGCNFPMLLVHLAVQGQLDPLPEPRRVISPGQYWIRTLDCGPVLVTEEKFSNYPTAGLESQ